MKNLKFILLLITIIVLSLLLFFPISPDLSIFLLGGRAISEGNKLYVDFIDLKQPLIYYFFAIIYKVFGSKEMSIRVFDVIYQSMTLYFLFNFLKKNTVNQLVPYFSILIYSIIYINQQYFGTFQVESFIALPLILIVKNIIKPEIKKINYIFSGILLGIIISLKITLVIILPFIFIYLFLITEFKETIKSSTYILLGFLLSIIIFSFPFLNSEIRNGFLEISNFLKFYSNIPPLNYDLLKYGIKNTGIFFGDNLGILIVILISFSFFSFSNFSNKIEKHLILLSYLILFSLIISVFVEKKFFIYHFSRIYIYIAILSSYGAKELFELFSKLKLNKKKSLVSLTLIIPLVLLFSPFPRLINQFKQPIYYFADYNKYLSNNEVKNDVGIRKYSINEIKSYLLNNKNENDRIIVISHGLQEINFLFPYDKISKFAHSAFYLSQGSSKKWQNEFIDEIKKANFLLLSKNTNTYLQLGIEKSDKDLIKSNPIMDSIFVNDFKICFQYEEFELYRRN